MRPKRGDAHPPWSVVVSFVGDHRKALDMRSFPLVIVEPKQRYRWDWLEGLHPVILVAPGIDASEPLRYAMGHGWSGAYPTLVDVKANASASVTSIVPFRIWPHPQRPLLEH